MSAEWVLGSQSLRPMSQQWISLGTAFSRVSGATEKPPGVGLKLLLNLLLY